MPTYIALMNWTDQGAKTADQTVTRYDAAKDDLAQLGVTIKDIYWTMGPYDIVTVVEAADDETASKGLMRLTSQGNLRTCTMRACSADEAQSLVGYAPLRSRETPYIRGAAAADNAEGRYGLLVLLVRNRARSRRSSSTRQPARRPP